MLSIASNSCSKKKERKRGRKFKTGIIKKKKKRKKIDWLIMLRTYTEYYARHIPAIIEPERLSDGSTSVDSKLQSLGKGGEKSKG